MKNSVAVNLLSQMFLAQFSEEEHEALGMAIDALNELPTHRPRGEWIDMGDFQQCSVCEGTHLKEFETRYGKALWVKSKYCPNCGADMRGEQDG